MSYRGDPDVRSTGFLFRSASYRKHDVQLDEQPVCVTCRGNIERGSEKVGRMCHTVKDRRVCTPCAYCNVKNSEVKYMTWLVWWCRKNNVSITTVM